MSSTQRRARRRPGENRARLLEAGLVEFGLLGYHGASTGSIAARAEVPQPHVYANFATKRDLFLACWASAREVLLEAAGKDVLATAGDDLLATAVSAPSADVQRFFYQAVAASAEPSLSAALVPQLRDLRAALQPASFDALIAAAAHGLLEA